MNKKITLPRAKGIQKTKIPQTVAFRSAIFGITLGMILLSEYLTQAQTAPRLAIAKFGTNEVSVTITNAIFTDSYEVWWTPVLGNEANYPWAAAAVGMIGQTNFSLSMNGLQSGFFQVLLDTNAIPLWEAAQPNNQAAGLLKITISNPTNGMTLN